jgi:hypothetical protein
VLLLTIFRQFIRLGEAPRSRGIVSPSGVAFFEGDDLPMDARGFFKGDEFRGARSSYVRNLKRFAELSDWLDASDPRSVQDHLRRAIAARAPAQPDVPSTTLERLAQHWSAVVCWSAGSIDASRYLELLPVGTSPWGLAPVDAADPVFSGLWNQASGERPDSPDVSAFRSTDQQTLSRFLESMRSLQPDSARIGWLCGDQHRGVRVSLWRGPGEPSHLDRDLSAADLEYWHGQLAQGAVTVTSGVGTVETPVESDTLRARLMLIVRTRDGDAYPLHVTSRYLHRNGKWVIETASRRSSIRAANLPSLAL